MFSYDEFKTKIKQDGLARQNRFYISIAPPSLDDPDSALFNDTRDIHLLCKGVTIPGVNIASTPTRLTGEMFEAPNDRTFGSATLTFYVDRKMYVRKFFDVWVNSIQNSGTRTFAWYSDFVSREIAVTVVDKQSEDTYTITLYDAFPKTIGALQLDQQQNDVMTLDVTFDYQYYITKFTDSTSNGDPVSLDNPMSSWIDELIYGSGDDTVYESNYGSFSNLEDW